MKKIIIFLFFISIFFIINLDSSFSQVFDTAEIKSPELRTGKKEVTMSLQFPKLVRNVDYDIIYKNNIALIKINNKLGDYCSLIIVDLENSGIIRSYNYVYQLVEVNNPNFILISLLMPKESNVLGSRRVDVQLKKPADIELANYVKNIALININDGEGSIIVNDNQLLLEKTYENPDSINPTIEKVYIDYITELNMFSYRSGGRVALYSLNNNSHTKINLEIVNPTYLGHLHNLGTILLSGDTNNKELYAYDIYMEKLYKLGNHIVEFDVSNNLENNLIYPLYNDKAFLFLTRTEDTNRDGKIDIYDQSLLFITFLASKTKHLIDTGPISNVRYYEESGFLSYEMIKDSNNDRKITSADEHHKIYLYDISNTQKVLLSNNGKTINFLDDFGIFLFNSYEKDTSRDGKINKNDIPSTRFYSIYNKNIKELSDSEVIDYEVNSNSLLYSVKSNDELAVYVYDFELNNIKLLARNVLVEKNFIALNKILLRRDEQQTYHAELMLYDVESKSLIKLGRNYIPLKQVNKSKRITENIYAGYVEKNNNLVMVQQASKINESGNEELTDYYNVILYNIQKKSKNIVFQGEIHDLGYTTNYGYVVTTIKIKGNINFKTLVVNPANMEITEIPTLSILIDWVGRDDRYLALRASDTEDELLIYDNHRKEYYTVMDNLTPIKYPTPNRITYSYGNYLIFNTKEDNLGLTSMYFIKPSSLLVRIGRFNGDYNIKEDLDYIILINNTLENNIVEMYFYSL